MNQNLDKDIERCAESNPAGVNFISQSSAEPKHDLTESSPINSSEQFDIPITPVLRNKLGYWNAKVESIRGLESRGITRVLPSEKNAGGIQDYLQMFALWFSIDLVAYNLITGFLGVLIFSLGWVDCIVIVIFADAMAAGGAAYLSTFGPESGNRTMVIGRYFMGYWPSKIPCVLNIIMQIGFGTVLSIVAGQMLSAVNGAGLTIAVGCIISALCTGLIASFGITLVHRFERYAYIPQIVAILVLIGSAGRNFDTSAVSIGSAGTVTANRCSYFTLVFASVIGYSAISADFYVYYPSTSPKWITFLTTWSGIWIAVIFCNIIGVGIATGVANTPAWSDAYNTSTGALLLACYNGLGGFGSLCVVILALGSITNNAPTTYSAALTVQVLGRYAKTVPRWVWCIVITIIELICSVAGRNHLFNILQNFLPCMCYWVCCWFTIVFEEHLFFHIARGVPFDWTAWEDPRKLPVGVAALVSFLIGWAGAIVGMYQVWYTGPVAAKVGEYGADIGSWLAIAFTGLTFPPLRVLELKYIGR